MHMQYSIFLIYLQTKNFQRKFFQNTANPLEMRYIIIIYVYRLLFLYIQNTRYCRSFLEKNFNHTRYSIDNFYRM